MHMCWRATRLERLDDDHATTAGRTRRGDCIGLLRLTLAIGRTDGIVFVDIEEGAYPGEIISAVAIGEQTIMADTVQPLG